MLLIIDRSQKSREAIRDICYHLGILSNTAAPEKASYEISNRYRAVLIVEPAGILMLETLIENLRVYSLGAPIFALSEKRGGYDESIFEKVFVKSTFSCDDLIEMIRFEEEHSKRVMGDYRLMGIDASVFSQETTFFDHPFKLTKTELMILKYLIRYYPNHASADDILKFAFRTARAPEISSIRTHISSINKKFLKISGRTLIVSEPRIGYRIMTPLLEARIAEEREKETLNV